MIDEHNRSCHGSPESNEIHTQDSQEMDEIISRLRNRNVAQLLDDIGDPSPMLVRSIKRQFTRFASDITQAIQGHDSEENNIGNR